ncbi:hypothetical protein L0Y65_04275 [Candidatus Micrarchaeota archaeon]|nr:hypothetical protein [Candidatus Micrarchaeota archaeon]
MIKFDPVTIATLAVLLAMVMLGASMFRSFFENPQVVYSEAPLQKNREFQLLPGETYRYSYLMNNTTANMTFIILEGEGCTRIEVAEARNSSDVCVDRWGLDKSGSNVSLGNPYILLFKPWMLALREGWTWNNSMFLSFDGASEYVTDNYYRVVRMENYSGRTSYIVEIKSGTGAVEYDWVDDEKRVLLRVQGEGYEVVLADD